ncbi:MAG: DUF3488 and transglutaminase-like domain-containing protein [Firmicutes bacterium]|nr:DUF3488 and transglutaminase-like domain-containing protein [Bacillota bacterium]
MSATTTMGSAPAALERYLELSVFLLLLVSTLTLATTGKLDLPSTVVPVGLLGVKAWGYWRGSGPKLSARTANRLVAAYLALWPVDLWWFSGARAQGAPVPLLYATLLATIHLMLVAMLVRLYSARTVRDYAFLGLLSFAMMLAAAVLTVDTAYLVFFVLFLGLAISTFIGLEMRRSAEGAVGARVEPGSPAAARLYRALRSTSVTIAASMLLLGAALFFLIPRYRAGYLGGYTLQPQLISGFDDDVTLGQIGEIKRNTEVVLRARLTQGAAHAGLLRWRGIALASFDGRRWFNPPSAPRVIEPNAGGWYPLGPAPDGLYGNAVELRYSILLEPLASEALFAPYRAVALRGVFAPEPERVGRPRRSYILMDATDSLSNPYQNFTRRLYEGISLLPAVDRQALEAAGENYPDPIREAYLQLPALDPRIVALAEEITRSAANPFRKAEAIERYLRTRFGYTLEQPGPPPADPLAHFLFERRAGHCEYFATAMTVMLRTLGIPARYVNGFLAGEYNEIGGDFIVRASDAHSWVEVYFPGYGWISFDPTPPAEPIVRSWLGRLALYWDWFELRWQEWVINYDAAHQQTLVHELVADTRAWLSAIRQFWQQQRRAAVAAVKSGQAALARSPYALPAALAALGLVWLLLRRHALLDWLVVRWGWSPSPRERFPSRVATLRYRALLRLLERHGHRKSPAQTPREFAQQLPWPTVTTLTELYEAARYGAQPAALETMDTLLAEFRRTLGANRRRRTRGNQLDRTGPSTAVC